MAVVAAVVIAVALGAAACGARQSPAAAPMPATPAEVTAGVTAAVEQWRQAWEARNADALAALYVPGLDVTVAQQGKVYRGATVVADMLRERFGRMKHARVGINGLSILALGDGVATATGSLERRYGDGVTTIQESGVVTFALVFHGGKWLIAAEHVSY